MKKMAKRMFKIIGGTFAVILIIGAIMAFSDSGESQVTSSDNPVEKQKEENEAEAKEEMKEEVKEEKSDEKGKISKDVFDQIEQGDSLTGEGGSSKEEVVELLGEPDTQTESQIDDMKMETMSWTTWEFKSISVTFTNGNVSSKMWME